MIQHKKSTNIVAKPFSYIMGFVSILLLVLNPIFTVNAQISTEEEFKGIGAEKNRLSTRVKRDTIESVVPDSLRSTENDLETTVLYDAVDSTIMDVGKQEVYLYGDAVVTYGDIKLEADYIRISWENAEIFAHGLVDSTVEYGEPVSGKPVFTQGLESYNTDTIRYNFKSEKAIIKNIVTQQGEGIIQGERVKKDPLDNLYLGSAKYTTCNLRDPHFHIASKRIKLVDKKSVVSGPFNLVLAGIPLPIGLPFGFFPVPKKEEIGTSGFIMGNYGEEPNNRGFYFRDFGYYHAFNEYIGAKVLAQVYSRGSWGLGVQSNYTKRYKFGGNLNLQFNKNKAAEFTGRQDSNDFNVSWSHSPQNRRPDRSFSASVNLVSNSFAENNRRLDEVDQYTNNTFGSSIQYSKNFGKLVRTSWGLRADQNVSTEIFNGSLSYNLALNQFNPFVPEKKQLGKWYESFRVGLNVTGGYRVTNTIANRSTTYTDYNVAGISNEPLSNEEERRKSELENLINTPGFTTEERDAFRAELSELSNPVLNFADAADRAQILENGVFNNSFSAPISLPNFKIAKYINFTPSISLRGDIFTKQLSYEFLNPEIGETAIAGKGTVVFVDENAETITNSYDDDGNLVVALNPNSGGVVVQDTVSGVYFAKSVAYGASMNTRFYGTYKFGEKGRLKAIRHTVAPSISASYTPDSDGEYASRTVVRSDLETGELTERYLSRFINSNGNVSPASARLSFGITNQLEAKLRSKSDTADAEFEKVSLLDNFSIRGGYNILADDKLGEFAFSDITMSANSSLFQNLISLNASGGFDLYAYEGDEQVTSNLAGRKINTFKWKYDGDPGNYLSRANLSVSTRLSPKSFNKNKQSNKKNDEDNPAMDAMEKFVAANPRAYVDFSIPWSVNLGYTINYNKQGLAAARITQALNVDGDLSLTEKWKIGLNTGWDFQFKAVTLTNISLMRELHCWDLSFNWTPIAGRSQRSSNYSFDLRVRSSLLRDLRLSRRRLYYDRGGF